LSIASRDDPDRAVVTLADPERTEARLPAVTELVGRWIRA